jgi:polo-like kinase 1
MTCGYMPTRLPLSCLTMAPRFDARLNSSIIAVRRPLGEVNRETKTPLIGIGEGPQGAKDEDHNPPNINPTPEAADVYTVGPPPEKLLRDLQHQLHRLFAAKPAEKIPMMMGKFVTIQHLENAVTIFCE